MAIFLIIILCFIVGFILFKQKSNEQSVNAYPKCTACHHCEVSETGWAHCNAPQNIKLVPNGNLLIGGAKLEPEHRCSSCNQARLGFAEVPEYSNCPTFRCRPSGRWFEPRRAEDPLLLPLKRNRQQDCCESHWNPEVPEQENAIEDGSENELKDTV